MKNTLVQGNLHCLKYFVPKKKLHYCKFYTVQNYTVRGIAVLLYCLYRGEHQMRASSYHIRTWLFLDFLRSYWIKKIERPDYILTAPKTQQNALLKIFWWVLVFSFSQHLNKGVKNKQRNLLYVMLFYVHNTLKTEK